MTTSEADHEAHAAMLARLAYRTHAARRGSLLAEIREHLEEARRLAAGDPLAASVLTPIDDLIGDVGFLEAVRRHETSNESRHD